MDFVQGSLGLDIEKSTLEDIQDALNKDSFKEEGIEEGFDLFILVKTLSDCNPIVKDIIEGF